MPASFPLTLDTKPPILTFGTPGLAQQGQTATLPWTLNEPSVIGAEFLDSTGKSWPIQFAPNGATMFVDPSIPEGSATIKVYTRDDVLNAATYTRKIDILGLAIINSPILTLRDQRLVQIVVSDRGNPNIRLIDRNAIDSRVSSQLALVITLANLKVD